MTHLERLLQGLEGLGFDEKKNADPALLGFREFFKAEQIMVGSHEKVTSVYLGGNNPERSYYSYFRFNEKGRLIAHGSAE